MPRLLDGAWIVFRKELLESLRERRAMISAFVFGPLFGPALFAAIIGFTVSRQVDESLHPITVPALGAANAANLMEHLHSALIDIEHDRFADIEALRDAVRRGDVGVGLVVDEGFTEALGSGAPARLWVVADGANPGNQAAEGRLRAALSAYSRTVGANRLRLRGVDPAVTQPLAILTDDVSTPSGRAILILGMMSYFLIFATLLGGIQVALDTTAGERERGTIEPLLTLPAPRSSLVIGKYVATLLFMAVSLAFAIGSFAVAVRFLPLAEIGMSSGLGLGVCLQIYFAMLPFAAFGAAMMVAVASYTKSLREAQTYTSLGMVVPALPIIAVAMNPIQPSLPWMLLPSLSQHMLVVGLIKGEAVAIAHVATSVAATLLLGALCLLVTVRRYRSERLLG